MTNKISKKNARREKRPEKWFRPWYLEDPKHEPCMSIEDIEEAEWQDYLENWDFYQEHKDLLDD